MAKTDEDDKNLCAGCTICCEYISLEIDEPEALEDVEHIRWYLYHKNVRVFITEEGWYIQFFTPCKALLPSGLCGVREIRPKICEEHDQESCERYGEGSEEEAHFTDPEKFLAWITKNHPEKLEK